MARAGPPLAPTNPFVIGHPAEGAHYLDREAETERIVRSFRDASSRLLVYGDRRLGKSSTIHAAAVRAREAGQPVAVVDLAAATSGAGASQRLLSAVYKEIGTRWRDALTRIAARLKGAVTITPTLDQQGTMSLGITVQPAGTPEAELRFFTDVLDAIEAELTERGMTLGLAIDEFQRLSSLTGLAIDWPFKALFEGHRRIAYVCAGSERGMIEQMLDNKKAGLWKGSDVLQMHPIPAPLLVRWIIERAEATGLRIDAITAAAICRMAGPRTRDVVQLARAVWDRTHEQGIANRQDAVDAMEALVREQSALHQRQWSGLDETAQRILLVLALDPAAELTAADTLARYRLGPKSTVQRVAKELEADEMVRNAGAPNGRAFDDPFFRRWVELNGLEDLGESPPPLLPPDWFPDTTVDPG